MADKSVNVLLKKVIFKTSADTHKAVNKNDIVIDLKSFS